MSGTPGNRRGAVSSWLRTRVPGRRRNTTWRGGPPLVVGIRRTGASRLDQLLGFDRAG